MAIDSNLGLTYREAYPVAGVDQSTQGFRDNFLILKRAIENLQTASSTTASLFSITTSIGTGGVVRLNIGYTNNAFSLPSGSPLDGAPQQGMIRQLNGIAEIHDGAAWKPILSVDAFDGVSVPMTGYFLLPTGDTSQRPDTPMTGMIRYNTDQSSVEVYVGNAWKLVSASGSNFEIVAGTVDNKLTLLTDATAPTDALSLRAWRNMFSNAVSFQNGGIAVTYDKAIDKLTVTPRNTLINLTGDVVGNASMINMSDLIINTMITKHIPTLPEIRTDMTSFITGQVRLFNNAVVESGITVTHDSISDNLRINPRDFSITLTGVVSGTGTVSSLSNVTIQTTTSLISGITVQQNGTPTGSDQSVQKLNFSGNGVTATQVGNVVTVAVPQGITLSDVHTDMQSFIRGISGINVSYDSVNQQLDVGAQNFNVTLTGPVTGTGLVSSLGDVTISTSTDRIKGLTLFSNSVQVGGTQSIQNLNFTGVGVTATQTGAQADVNFNLLTTTDVQNTVGSFITSAIPNPGSNTTTESGVTVTYDQTNHQLQLGVRDFAVSLSGVVNGSATVSRLNDITINTTTTNLISGLTIQSNSVATGLPQSVKQINFVGNAITTTQSGNTVTVSVPVTLTPQQVQDQVGSLLKGTIRDNNNVPTESGVTVVYDAQNDVVELGVRDFTIGLSGVVNGSATISRLNDATITTTTTSLIQGLNAQANGTALSASQQSVKNFNFTGAGVSASQSGNTVTVSVGSGLTLQNVRDDIGPRVRGVVIDPNTGISTNSGINVTYDANNGLIDVAPRDVTFTLTGPITGTATMTRLGNVSIATQASFIDGLDITQNGILLGRHVSTLDVEGGGATVNGTTVSLNLNAATNTTQVRSIVTGLVQQTGKGITATYNANTDLIAMTVLPLTVQLTGAISGNGVINFTGAPTDGNVVITTAMAEIGIEVQDEGQIRGSAVKSVNFVGAGITSAVSVDGDIATVFVPNSPANEQFVLVNNGSANVPNSRKLTAGTGILITDNGPGSTLEVAAFSDQIIAKSQIALNGTLIAERARINIVSTNEIIPEITDDSVNNEVNIQFFSLNDGWYRNSIIDMGLITDKYGPSIVLGDLTGGIIEVQADMGLVTDAVA